MQNWVLCTVWANENTYWVPLWISTESALHLSVIFWSLLPVLMKAWCWLAPKKVQFFEVLSTCRRSGGPCCAASFLLLLILWVKNKCWSLLKILGLTIWTCTWKLGWHKQSLCAGGTKSCSVTFFFYTTKFVYCKGPLNYHILVEMPVLYTRSKPTRPR